MARRARRLASDQHVCAVSTMGARREGVDVQDPCGPRLSLSAETTSLAQSRRANRLGEHLRPLGCIGVSDRPAPDGGGRDAETSSGDLQTGDRARQRRDRGGNVLNVAGCASRTCWSSSCSTPQAATGSRGLACPNRRVIAPSGARELGRQARWSSPRPHAATPRRHRRAR